MTKWFTPKRVEFNQLEDKSRSTSVLWLLELPGRTSTTSIIPSTAPLLSNQAALWQILRTTTPPITSHLHSDILSSRIMNNSINHSTTFHHPQHLLWFQSTFNELPHIRRHLQLPILSTNIRIQCGTIYPQHYRVKLKRIRDISQQHPPSPDRPPLLLLQRESTSWPSMEATASII